MRDLVGIGGIVGQDSGVRGRDQRTVAVRVLEPLARQRRAARCRAQHEASRHLVGCRPDRVAGTLEPEHRVEDIDRDHRHAVSGVGRPGSCERSHRAVLVDAEVQDLPLLRLLVGEHQVRVDRLVLLPVRVVDLGCREEGVHPEGARLVRDDRHHMAAELLVAHQLPQDAHERHRGGDLLLSGALLGQLVCAVVGQLELHSLGPTLGHRSTQLVSTLDHVLDGRVLRAGVVVRRQVGVALELLVRDGDVQRVPECLEVVDGELLHLVGGVAPREVPAQAVALDGLGQDHRRLAVVVHCRLVGRIHLAVVVAAPLEVPPDVRVRPVLHHRLGARVATEKVLADVGAVVGSEGLIVAISGGVHQVHQGAVAVRGQKPVPPAAPDDLDDVPARTAEARFELLDDLAVAADRPIKSLQVAVDHKGEVVQLVVGGDVKEAA